MREEEEEFLFWYQEKVRQTYEPKVVSVCVYSSNWLSMARQVIHT